jgi:hypothetical protein
MKIMQILYKCTGLPGGSGQLADINAPWGSPLSSRPARGPGTNAGISWIAAYSTCSRTTALDNTAHSFERRNSRSGSPGNLGAEMRRHCQSRITFCREVVRQRTGQKGLSPSGDIHSFRA